MTMTEKKSLLRNVVDAMIEARTRQAERMLANYRNTIDTYSHHANRH